MTADREELESLLLGLLREIAPLLDQTTAEQIREFVDANEFGLALEWAIDFFDDENLLIPQVARGMINQAARAMDIEPEISKRIGAGKG